MAVVKNHSLGAPELDTHRQPRNGQPKAPARPQKIPLHQLYALPAPIRTFPLPSFYPNNPLSLFHVLWTWSNQLLSPPPAEPSVVHQGHWSPETRSVHVHDPTSVRALWEQGFFGKGSYSRSEPNWLKREQTRQGQGEKRVSELVTVQRREERKMMKWERARKEQEAILRTRIAEAWIAPVGPKELLALPNSLEDLRLSSYGLTNGHVFSSTAEPNGHVNATQDARLVTPTTPDFVVNGGDLSDPPSPHPNPLLNGKVPGAAVINGTPPLSQESDEAPTETPDVPPTLENEATSPEIVDREHLQLTLEETFYLVFGLGALNVTNPSTGKVMATEELFHLFRQLSYAPSDTAAMQPDDPFLIQYAVYHHFRSLGWVPRPGIKFGVDWLLYIGGPVFAHAEFAVMVLPAYTDPYWKTRGHEPPQRSWHWLHSINRVQAHALKTMVIVYVDIPPPTETSDPASLLKRYKIREFVMKRWLSNRSRE
ncbi:hypothetical protein NPX13_g10626 [Xylaria arbuscula]|uniref:tRNA-splicing endonuclease subunit Sen2 n=1 Tax=Xylaria arbuscula TaxID=114810 RepID=A0A9W8TGE7_9PEZI|nr:hypothetical protein NPX13_g10626 [Xylaria arbuscula]